MEEVREESTIIDYQAPFDQGFISDSETVLNIYEKEFIMQKTDQICEKVENMK